MAGDPDHLEHDRDEHDDPEHAQDRPGAQVDDPLRRHPASIRIVPAGYALRMSLRSSPAVVHVALPDGGSVTVWVGVPDDPYLERAQQTNVDLQLREGDTVLATVTTVLDVAQEGEAHQLAREVGQAVEAGETALTAAGLEPFADRLR